MKLGLHILDISSFSHPMMQGVAALVRSSILPHWHLLSVVAQLIFLDASSRHCLVHAGIWATSSWMVSAAARATKAERTTALNCIVENGVGYGGGYRKDGNLVGYYSMLHELQL